MRNEGVCRCVFWSNLAVYLGMRVQTARQRVGTLCEVGDGRGGRGRGKCVCACVCSCLLKKPEGVESRVCVGVGRYRVVRAQILEGVVESRTVDGFEKGSAWAVLVVWGDALGGVWRSRRRRSKGGIS